MSSLVFFLDYCITIRFYDYFYFYLFFNSSSVKDSFKFLTKYLATFSGEDAYKMSEAKEEAVHAIVDFVKAPDMFQVSTLL